jgi:hypothetical protein
VKASETDLKNLFYRELEARHVLELLMSATSTWTSVLHQTVTS